MKQGFPSMGVLIGVAVILIVFSVGALTGPGVRTARILLAITAAVFLGLALYNLRLDSGKTNAVAAGIVVVVCVVLMFAVSENIVPAIVPECGDGFCTEGECQDACEDCSPDDCIDGNCLIGFERCDNSVDCPCPTGMLCSPNREGATPFGCFPIVCGDSYCDEGETQIECCQDCGCQEGYQCENNICFFEPPRITFIPTILTKEIGATTLAANPYLANFTGIAHPLSAVEITNSISPASDVVITFSLPGYAERIIPAGELSPGEKVIAQWYLNQEPSFLTLLEDTEMDIHFSITYTDIQGIAHEIKRTYPITILQRNTLDSTGHYIFFITPENVPLDSHTVEDIWGELSGGFEVLPESENIQFPIETLMTKKGTATDIAILLASAFQKKKLQPGFMFTEEGIFVWTKDSGDFRILDPRKINSNFAKATVDKIGAFQEMFHVHQIWEAQAIQPIDFGPEYVPGVMIRTKKDIIQTCAETDVEYTVSNAGLVESSLCASSAIGVDTEDWCFTLDGKGSITLEHNWLDTDCSKPAVTFSVVNQTG